MKSWETLVATVAVLVLVSSASEAQQSRYREWKTQPQTGELPELLDNLRKLTDQAEQSRAADPAFLDDLRKLTNAYQDRYSYAAQWPVRLIHDDFHDGNYTRNPAWTVVAGTWQVITKGNTSALHNAVSKAEAAAAPSAPGPATTQDVLTNVFGAIVGQQSGRGTPTQPPTTPVHPTPESSASILLPVAITNAFAARLEFTSRDPGGRFDFGPYVGQHGDTSYRVTYAPAAESGLVLSRVTNHGTQLLGSSNGRVGLEDDKPHVIDWRRDQAGKMTVALDGEQVIEATDTDIRKPFDGLTMINGGGAYWIHTIAVNGAK
jgi:hypothetical protein